jgi:hypothetical protein
MTATTRSAATIADALHLAADKYLAANLHQFATDIDKSMFSCNAVSDACCELGVNFGGVLVGLKNMGCDVTSDALFKQFTVIEQVQGMRYMWLKWAALMAEEQGV